MSLYKWFIPAVKAPKPVRKTGQTTITYFYKPATTTSKSVTTIAQSPPKLRQTTITSFFNRISEVEWDAHIPRALYSNQPRINTFFGASSSQTPYNPIWHLDSCTRPYTHCICRALQFTYSPRYFAELRRIAAQETRRNARRAEEGLPPADSSQLVSLAQGYVEMFPDPTVFNPPAQTTPASMVPTSATVPSMRTLKRKRSDDDGNTDTRSAKKIKSPTIIRIVGAHADTFYNSIDQTIENLEKRLRKRTLCEREWHNPNGALWWPSVEHGGFNHYYGRVMRKYLADPHIAEYMGQNVIKNKKTHAEVMMWAKHHTERDQANKGKKFEVDPRELIVLKVKTVNVVKFEEEEEDATMEVIPAFEGGVEDSEEDVEECIE